MKLQFTKMHGIGNDFVVIDAISQQMHLTPTQVKLLADRHFGIGCDQVLMVEKPRLPETDFRYRIFNADGGEVGQCGNGARCFALFVRRRGLTHKDEIAVETKSGIIYPRIEADDQVTVNMGRPVFAPQLIPFVAETESNTYDIDVGSERLTIGAVSMGNPHAVIRVDNVETALVQELGTVLQRHPRFPERVNVSFVQIVDRRRVRLRVFERGVGETLACGTGACAAVAVGIRNGLLDDEVEVSLPGGCLTIRWPHPREALWLTGPATFVYEGTIEL
jgi:diaminopimelate epimerase